MPLTKDNLKAALTAAKATDGSALLAPESVLWTTACDTYAAVKLAAPKELPGAQAMAEGAKAAADDLARREGTRLDSFIVEFVDHAGSVVRTVRFGAGAAPQTVNPASAGHTPIAGLRPPASGDAGPLPNVRRIVAVGAGKGGVGKSTVALNLAVGLARRGHAVGLLDADIYGPSMPTMLALEPFETIVHAGVLQPFFVHGVKAMTIGKLVDPDKPLIWRGPMAHGAFKQLAEQTAWGELDYLVIDLPPGTGDVSLTMAQLLRLTGAVVVCTPQKVAQDDAARATRMFQQLKVPVLGVVENMSCFIGDDGKAYDIFGRGGAEVMAQRLSVPFLGALPITMSLRENSDKGDPTSNFTAADPAGRRLAEALEKLLTNLEGQVALAEMQSGQARPTLTIS